MPSRPVARLLAKRVLPLLAAAVCAALVAAPAAFGSSTGMNSEAPGFPTDFAEKGCTSCHGGPDHAWAAGPSKVAWEVTGPAGSPVTSGSYEADASYTINITLEDEVNPEASNHAGFYLKATAGEFHVVEGSNVQVTAGGLEASHTDASATSWSVQWTAPHDGAVAFTLIVNDVDGSAAPDEGDHVYRHFFALTDSHGAQLGAAAGEEHVEFGISLQQYWIGLLGLAGMVLIILASFVYLKWMNPHHTGPKDR